jgi:diaminohydroxyphosphoribosylaminopyrimidine deaminase/5-amino-6-(5-phosphoribosylamino)uracil reductase
MRLALRLARRGLEGVSPNPLVGAVLARRGRVVGRGAHLRFGGPHAEVEALRAAGAAARGADLFVTLEPCAHHGKTPPCADLIARSGVRRVVYAARDPNPLTRGRGPRLLRAHGVRVEEGLCREEAETLNAPYFHWRREGRPWVLLKWAMTLDGKIATAGGESRWITGEAARHHAHGLRRRVDAVIVGTETARRDDPRLLPRPARGRRPLRVVLDRRGRLPLTLKLFAKGPAPARGPATAKGPAAPASGLQSGATVYVTSSRSSRRRRRELERRGVKVLILPGPASGLPPRRLLAALGALGISQVLVEGGGRLAGSLLRARLVDEVAAYIAPRLAGGRRARGAVEGKGFARLVETPWLEGLRVRRLGEDVLVEGRVGGRRARR